MRITVYHRFSGDPAVPPGWYIACPDAYVGPCDSIQAAESRITDIERHCPWPHQVLHLPHPIVTGGDQP